MFLPGQDGVDYPQIQVDRATVPRLVKDALQVLHFRASHRRQAGFFLSPSRM